jgi:hypothetical protein
MVQDGDAEHHIDRFVGQRQLVGGCYTERSPVGDAVKLGTLPSELDQRFRKIERNDARAAPGERHSILPGPTAEIQDTPPVRISEGAKGVFERIAGVVRRIQITPQLDVGNAEV